MPKLHHWSLSNHDGDGKEYGKKAIGLFFFAVVVRPQRKST